MFSYNTFVKSLQIILVFTFLIMISLVMKEDYESLTTAAMVFFPLMIILVELFRGDGE